SSRRRHTRFSRDWSSDVCSSDLAMLKAGWEFIGHGMHQKALNFGGDEAEQITATLDKIAGFTGTRPRGWLSPGLRETVDTPDLQIGRASCRERGESSVVDESLKV